jgi:hypothetical protein
MGRGLGKTQQAILDHLRERGEEVYVSTMAWAIYHDQPCVRELDPVPRAFEVSIRRAVHALAERGLVCYGYEAPRYLSADDPHPRLLCWLPGHRPASLTPIIRGADVDRLVLTALAAADSEPDNFFIHRRLPGMTDERWPEYSWLTNEVVKKLGGNMIEGARATAIHRSVKRLAQQGKIRICNQSYNRIGWVKLNIPVSVAE